MANQALDSALERNRRGWAAGAGAVHGQIEVSVLVPAIGDVAAILGNGGADASFDQLLDLIDDLSVLGTILEGKLIEDMNFRGRASCEQRGLANEMVEERFKDEGFKLTPRDTGRCGDGNEVAAVKDALDHAAIEQGARKRRCIRGIGVGKIACPRLHYGLARQELAGGGVGCLLGSDQHDGDLAIALALIKDQREECRR